MSKKFWVAFSNDVERGGVDYVEFYGVYSFAKQARKSLLRKIESYLNNDMEELLRHEIFEDDDNDNKYSTFDDFKDGIIKELKRINKFEILLDVFAYESIDYFSK